MVSVGHSRAVLELGLVCALDSVIAGGRVPPQDEIVKERRILLPYLVFCKI